MNDGCIFCAIAAGQAPASLVHEDALTLAFLDLRQAHPGHVLAIPRRHCRDLRELDDATGAALMKTLSRVTRAVAAVFPHEGISIWHSIGQAARQEVPHLHFHVHPRRLGDGLLRVYPSAPARPPRATLDRYAAALREQLAGDMASPR
ncbi:HIT family protein [Rehaibacterium terrae]|jgi:histidine triad (HIT) family protein|uniref:Histidine triad (HIT) family protein n=1 Tax=Rehaibacterium terrae TaxID=1341696 RepID=A0A7W7XYQ0_9GAMM|nr:HIT family protein [Rehaibacterium terrae]MBB5014875.1 histidine triad (HIT) family protein [Rehaibacterium terrae]